MDKAKLQEARDHWAPDQIDRWERKVPEWGAQRLRMVDFLIAEAVALGWVKE